MISKATAWLRKGELNNECGQIILPENFFCAVDLLIQTFMDVPLVEFMYLVFTRMPGESLVANFSSPSVRSQNDA